MTNAMTNAVMSLALLRQRWDWDDHPMHWDRGWIWLWGTLLVLTWAAIIAAVVAWLVVRANRHGNGGGGGEDTRAARQILDERLARGDITLEEYRERRDALR